ncbi:hypothetical protein [uncultured Vibrio sp.]|nr:hypothetical protein [uncultured Vibrio sp.]
MSKNRFLRDNNVKCLMRHSPLLRDGLVAGAVSCPWFALRD